MGRKPQRTRTVRMSLVEKAKAVQVKRGIRSAKDSDEFLELMCAWLSGMVTDVQAAAALDVKSTNINSRAAYAIKRAIIAGRVRIEIIK